MAVGEGPGKRLSVNEWAEIQARYETGESLSELARDYDVSVPTISKRAKKYEWKRADDIYAEAMAEARETVKERVRSDYQEKIERANENQQKLFQFSQKFAFEMMQQLYQSLEAFRIEREEEMKKQRALAEARGETNFTPKPVFKSLGKLPYEARATYDMLRDAVMSERIVIHADSFDPNADEGDGGSTERLIDIFKAGRLASAARNRKRGEGVKNDETASEEAKDLEEIISFEV